DERFRLVLEEWSRKQGYSSKESRCDLIYVNGDNNLENLKAPDDTWKVRLIEEDFIRLMFDTEGMECRDGVFQQIPTLLQSRAAADDRTRAPLCRSTESLFSTNGCLACSAGNASTNWLSTCGTSLWKGWMKTTSTASITPCACICLPRTEIGRAHV